MKTFLLSVFVIALFSISNLYSQDIKAKLKGHLAVNGFTVVDDNGKILFRVTGEGNVGILTDDPTSLFEVGRDLETDGIPRSIFIKGESTTSYNNVFGGDAIIEGGNNSVNGGRGGQIKVMGGDYDGGNIEILGGDGEWGGNIKIQSGAGDYAGNIEIRTPDASGNITPEMIIANGINGTGIHMFTSDGFGGSSPAPITFETGRAGSPITLRTANSSWTDAGDIILIAGNSDSYYEAGNINLTPGTGTPNGLVVINGSGTVSGTWTVASDERYKKNIEPLNNVLDKINNLDGVSYEFKTDEFPDKNFSKGKQIGLIAQNVESEFPELVQTDKDGYKSVAYQNMVAVLLEAIKEQQKSIDQLKKEVDKLKSNQNIEVTANTESNN